MQKLIAKIAGSVVALALVVSAASTASALTSAEITALLVGAGIDADTAAVLAAALGDNNTTTTSNTGVCSITRDLTIGATGADVVTLQDTLIANNFLVIPAGVSKGYFGTLTQSAVAQWQMSLGVTPAVGYFGNLTRGAIASSCTTTVVDNGGSSNNGSSSSSTGLMGGAGSIDSYDLDSSYSNEEIGEGEDDVEVYGLEIEASDESDIEVIAVAVDLGDDTGSDGEAFANGSDDFDDYATELSIWFDGEKVGEVDADEFDDDNNYRRTITLDRGVVIEMGDTETIVVAVSSVNNVDSDDFDQVWTVAIDSVRYMDAQGTVITEDPGQDDESFDFTTFADSSNAELKIRGGDDSINDSRILKVEDNDDVQDVEILSFEVEVDGSSDLDIDDIVVEFTVGGTATELNDIASKVTLFLDGDEIDSQNTTTDGTVTFDDLDLELEAGDSYDFVVAVDILEYDAAGTYDLGDTILAKVSATERNLWDIEDEEGDSLDNSDRSGAETSEAHTLSLSDVEITNISWSSSKTDTTGVIDFFFTVNADDDAYDVLAASIIDAATGEAFTNTAATIETDAFGILSRVSGDSAVTIANEGFTVADGDSVRFRVRYNAAGAGAYEVNVSSVAGVEVSDDDQLSPTVILEAAA